MILSLDLLIILVTVICIQGFVKSIIKIALVDEHILMRHALARLIDSFENCEVILELNNGQELLKALDALNLPDVILLDVNMPVADSFKTAAYLCSNYPSIHIVMLTMFESDQVLLRLLQIGIKGFLKKDVHPNELKFAISSVMQSGFYCSQQVSAKIANFFNEQPHCTS